MAANHRRYTMLQADLGGVLPHERPADWPGGLHWDSLWDCLDSHVHGGVPIVLLARRYEVTEDRMRRWLAEARNQAHALRVIP